MKIKITGIFLLFVVVYTVILGKALYVQVLNRDKLLAYSESQIVRKTKIYPKRGYILDRNNNPLAINVQKYNIFTFAKDTEQIEDDLKVIKKILPKINISSLTAKIKKRKRFTWIKREIKLTDEQVSTIKNLSAIQIESQSSRFYPNHELLAQTLGFVGIDNNGLAGLEYAFNDKLQGEPEIYKYFRDAKGRPVKFRSTNLDKRGDDIVLSIDKDIQATVEEYLKQGVQKHEASSGGAAVMDASTGELLAIANYPAFDPNTPKRGGHKKLAFVTDPFEPGSVFKTLTIASAIENNIVRSDTSYFCERGKYKVGNHYISESDSRHAHEWLSVAEILKYSSNIGTTKIAFDLTYPHLKQTLNDFYIGEKTNIEMPGESRGILDEAANITPLRLSNISFGQGVATTGIQMLASYAPFANGGYYVQPTLLKVDDRKKIKAKKVIKSETANMITEMLIDAVDEGTGKNARIKHFKIAGKTSTAQRANGSGGYSGYTAGFLGYPVDTHNKIVVFVYIDDPKKGYYGNTVAAPIFQKIVKSILYKEKNIKGLSHLAKNNQDAIDNISIKYSARRKVQKGFVPDLVGLDKHSTFKILESLDLKYKHTGFGIVDEQFPAPGEKISSDTVMNIKFKAPAYE